MKRVRKDVALGNGFRKYAISCFVRAKVNHEVRQMLVDHKGGYLDESYLRIFPSINLLSPLSWRGK